MTAKNVIVVIAALVVLGVAALSWGDGARDAYNEALKLHRAGMIKEAIASYDKAIKINPRLARSEERRVGKECRL